MADFPVIARISRYDATDGWVSAWEIPRQTIESVRADFRPFRIEDRADLSLTGRSELYYAGTTGGGGAYTSEDLVSNLQKYPREQYRLDVYSPDRSDLIEDVAWTSGRSDLDLFWSGIITRINFDRSDQTARISAVGFSKLLENIAVSKRLYQGMTAQAILQDLHTNVISPAWPGTIDLVEKTEQSDANLILDEVYFPHVSARAAIQYLAAFGNFFSGVAVSGFPHHNGGKNEFRLIFAEAAFDLDPIPPSAAESGLGYDVGVFVDVQNDANVETFQESREVPEFYNRWEVAGESLHADVMSIMDANSKQYVYDGFAFDSGETSGVELWEARGFTGWDLVFVDLAKRSNTKDKASGNRYYAGRLDPLPSRLSKLDGDATFRISEWSEISATHRVRYDLRKVPLGASDPRSVTSSAYRYVLRPNGSRVYRTVENKEETHATTGREAIAHVLQSDDVRGHLQAGILALQELAAQHHNMESATLVLKNVRTSVVGSNDPLSNRIMVSTGAERMTTWGTVGNGGDGFAKGDDDRAVGLGKTFEIRRARATLEGDGWRVAYTLGSAPKELAAVLPPLASRKFAVRSRS